MVAIIEQATIDLKNPKHAAEARRFFYSDWYCEILQLLDLEPGIKPIAMHNKQCIKPAARQSKTGRLLAQNVLMGNLSQTA